MALGSGLYRSVLTDCPCAARAGRVTLPPSPKADQTLGVTPRGDSSRAVFTNFRLGLCFGAAVALLGDGQACVLCVTSLSVAVA